MDDGLDNGDADSVDEFGGWGGAKGHSSGNGNTGSTECTPTSSENDNEEAESCDEFEDFEDDEIADLGFGKEIDFFSEFQSSTFKNCTDSRTLFRCVTTPKTRRNRLSSCSKVKYKIIKINVVFFLFENFIDFCFMFFDYKFLNLI